MKSLVKLVIVFKLLLLNNAFALDPEIVDVSYSGSGCEQDSASVVLSPDNKVLSIMFDNYQVAAGSIHNRPRQQKNCDLKIKIEVPAGKRVMIEKFDYRGYAFLPMQAQARFKSTYFYHYTNLGKKTYPLSKQKTLLQQMDDEFLIEQKVIDVFNWTTCSESFELNVLSEIEVKTNRHNEEVLVSLDSFDSAIDAALDYHLIWEDCQDTNNGRINNGQHSGQSSSGNSTPNRDQLRDQARCRRTGQC